MLISGPGNERPEGRSPSPHTWLASPECELTQVHCEAKRAEVDEGTAHGDVKVEKGRVCSYQAEGMSGKA